MSRPPKVNCSLCPQRKTGIFAGLDDETLERLACQRTLQKFKTGQEIFCAGGPPLAVYCMHSGKVRLSMSGDRGEELVLELGEPGRVLGLRAVLACEPYESTATAIETTVACTIPAEVFERALADAPTAALQAARVLARDVRKAHARLLEALQRSVPQRAAHALLSLHVQALGKSPGSPAPIRIARVDLAHIIGTTPETLSRVLHMFESRGALAVTRKDIRIRNADVLRSIARLRFDEA